MSFYKELVEVEENLKERGFEVNIPVSAHVMKKKNDFDVSHFKHAFTPGEKATFIRKNFQTIAKGDVILVINNEKNHIKGYIGANVLMEIGLAFYLKKKIYIWNAVDENAPYKEELLAFGVDFIHKDINKIT
jgi:nucleoside 2-deoxyribosyltransferase